MGNWVGGWLGVTFITGKR